MSNYSVCLRAQWVTGKADFAPSERISKLLCAMRLALDPFRLLLISFRWLVNQRLHDALDYPQEENRVLREQLGGKRLRFNDDQRRRLAVRAKKLGWRMLHEVTIIVSRNALILASQADRQKYDGSRQRGPSRRRTGEEIQRLVVRMATENRDWELSENPRSAG
jgi:putative transposase